MEGREDPDHPILTQLHLWEISRVEWQSISPETQTSFLDVTFTRDGSYRRLRFNTPQNVVLHLQGSYPAQCGEMALLDIRHRQLEGLGVQVTDYGSGEIPLQLYAHDVVEVPCE